MSRRALAALGAGVALTLTVSACGSTSNVGSGSSSPTPAQVAFGDQICGQGGADKPGYQNTATKLTGGADKLSGAGSTFVNPVMSVWTKDYATAGGVQVAYQSIGSGGGVAQIQAQTVDFGASDAPMSDADIAKAKGGAILHIPLTLGAVVPAYNVKGLPAGLKWSLSRCAYSSRSPSVHPPTRRHWTTCSATARQPSSTTSSAGRSTPLARAASCSPLPTVGSPPVRAASKSASSSTRRTARPRSATWLPTSSRRSWTPPRLLPGG